MAAFVKSVEFIDYALTGTTAAVNLTKGQDYTNCVPFLSLYGCSDYMDSHFTDVYFSGTTESGVINFDRDETRGCTMNIKCYVVEFDPNEIRVQQGIANGITNSITQHTVASGVDPSKTGLMMYWKSTSGNQYWADHMVRYRLDTVSGTYVDTYRGTNGGSVDGHYFLFEDISPNNDHFIVDHQDKSFTGNANNSLIAEGQRDVTKTIILGNYACTDTTLGNNYSQTVRFISYFNAFSRCDRNYSLGTIYWYVQHLTFKDGSKLYVPYMSYSYLNGSNTTSTEGWTGYNKGCNLDTSAVIPTSPYGVARSETGGASSRVASIDSIFTGFELETTKSIRYTRNSAGYSNDTNYFGWQVVDWLGVTLSSGTNPAPLDHDMTFVKSVENFRLNPIYYLDTYELTKGQNWENCVPFVSYRSGSSNAEIREKRNAVWIREPGLVCAHRTDSGGNGIVDVSVVEFYPDKVKVQQGDWVHWGGTDVRSTLASGVSNTDRAFAVASWECNNAASWARTNIRVRFTANDELQFYRANTNDMIGGNWFVVEDLGDNFRVEHYTDSSTGQYVQLTSEIFSYYRCCIPFASIATSDDDDNAYDGTARIYVDADHQVFGINKNTAGATTYGSFQIMRFLDDRRHTQYMAPSMTTTSYTYDLGDQMLTHSGSGALSVICPMLNSFGRNTSSAANSIRASFHTARLINNETQVEITREYNEGTTYASYFTPVDWIGYVHPLADNKGNIPIAYPNKSLVRSIQKFTNSATTYDHYMTKGQIAANCVPFASYRVGVDDAIQARAHKAQYIDTVNYKVITAQSAGSNGGTQEEVIYLVEFNPDRVKVQHIKVAMVSPNTSKSVTIPESIDTERTMLWISYTTSNWSTGWGYGLLEARITSSTNIDIQTNYNNEGFMISIFLMEALDDAWYVTRSNGSDSGTGPISYGNFHYGIGIHNRFVQGTYRSNEADDNCYDQTVRVYPRQDHGIQWNKQTAGATLYYNTEIMEFNPAEGVRVGGYWLDLSSAETSETKSIVDDTKLDVDRTMVAPTVMQSINRVDSSAANAVSDVCCKLELTGENEVTITKHNTAAQTYGYFQYVQWPEFKTHYFQGTITERGVPVSRTVSCYRSDTNEIMDSTTSDSITGAYELQTTYSGEHYIVAQDDIPGIIYNDMILGRMMPDPIPAALSTTYSGSNL